MPAVCNFNGVITAEQDARIPVLDRGFLFGDSVYEVLRTRGGVPFAWPEHLARLRASAHGIGLDLDLDDQAIMGRVVQTLAAAQIDEAYIRIVVTRGTGSAPSIDLDHAPGPANYVILVRDLPKVRPEVHLALIPRLRTDRRALDPAIKSGNYLNNLLGLAEAKARGATECLFLNRDGQLTEASTSNFYMVRDGVIVTPAPGAGLLSGITRGLLLDLCESIDLELKEQDLGEADLAAADEVFLSSTLRDIVPVTVVDGAQVGDGKPGPVTRRLAEQFDQFCERLARDRYGPELDAL